MKYRKLGTTDIEVSAVCLGGWSLIGDDTWGEQAETDSVSAIHGALDAGVNFFDTAEGYGRGESERLLGKVLSGRRKDVIIATKVSRRNLAPDALKDACEDSLRRLGTDVIDLYQVHWPRPDVPLAETMGAMEELKAAGKVRAVGVSNFGKSYLADLLEVGHIESNQLCYSLLWRAIEHEVQPICVANDVGILCYSPLAQGLLTGKFASVDDVPESRARTRLFSKDRVHARHDELGCEEAAFAAVAGVRDVCESIGKPMGQLALAWLLAQEGVTSVIVGARNPQQAAQNAASAEIELCAEALRKLSRATEPVKKHIGVNGDMWQSDSRMEH